MSDRIIFVFATAADHEAWRAACVDNGLTEATLNKVRKANDAAQEYDSTRCVIGPRADKVSQAMLDAADEIEGVTVIGPDGWENWKTTVNWVDTPIT